METESHLDEMIAGLSNESGPSIEGKADELIRNLEEQRIQKYADISSHIKELKSRDQIDQKVFDHSFSKLLEVSIEEFGQPLNILEIEKSMDFFTQFETQKKCFVELGILKILPKSKRLGFVGIDDKEYPLPDLTEISSALSPEELKLLQTKIGQGFNQVILTPFALKLDELIGSYQQLLLSKHRQGQLLSATRNPLVLNLDKPIQTSYFYEEAQEIIYYPNELTEDRQGQTKTKLLSSSAENAWHISLFEDLSEIPEEGKGKVTLGRKQLEAGHTAVYYLQVFKQDPVYQGEHGLAVEDWLAYAMSYLYLRNTQIDNRNEGKICLNLATSSSTEFDEVSACCFDAQNRNVSLFSQSFDIEYLDTGIRTLVNIY